MFGGLGEGLLGLVTITEALGAACSSTSMCFGMHCVASAVIGAKSSAHCDEKYQRPIAEARPGPDPIIPTLTSMNSPASRDAAVRKSGHR